MFGVVHTTIAMSVAATAKRIAAYWLRRAVRSTTPGPLCLARERVHPLRPP